MSTILFNNAAPQISFYIKMLGLNPGLLQCLHGQSETRTSRLDLIPTRLDLVPKPAIYHPQSARSSPFSARFHPHSVPMSGILICMQNGRVSISSHNHRICKFV